MENLSKREYTEYVKSTQEKRMQWFKDARFGMFIHFGLYSQLGTGEWSMANESYTVKEYEKLAKSFAPKEGICDEWCKLARDMGAKYVVLTTRHHDGFSLWNSKVNPYNSYAYCKRDIVQEFVDACRKYDLKIGFYSSLMDWHRKDGWTCANDPKARETFTKYIEDLNVELLSNYGKIDILWYDVSCPLGHYESWDSVNRNYRLRQLQPDIIINNRSKLDEDFGTPEEHIAEEGEYFESCLTLTKLAWGYTDAEQSKDFIMRPKEIVRNLHMCTCKGGNLLLNISPDGDGHVDKYTKSYLEQVGAWLKVNGEVTYGEKFPSAKYYSANSLTAVSCTKDQKTFYLWNWVWPKTGELRIGGYMDKPKRISYVATKEEIDFSFDGHLITLHNLPKECPDKILGITALKMEFDEKPRHTYRSYYPQLFGGCDMSEGNNKWE